MEEKLPPPSPPPEKQKTTRQIKLNADFNVSIKGSITDVIVQTFKMSGDRYTIASSLILNNKMGVILLTTQAPGTRSVRKKWGSSILPRSRTRQGGL